MLHCGLVAAGWIALDEVGVIPIDIVPWDSTFINVFECQERLSEDCQRL